MKTEIRQPKQSRAIEKKNKIIRAGYELFSEKGYFGSTTPEIAKLAGVSTGIVYGYFSDKRDILLCVLDIYLKEVSAPIMEVLNALSAPVDTEKLIRDLMNKTIEQHVSHSRLHETLHSLTASDKDVSDRFLALENHVTRNVTAKLTGLGVETDHCAEKVHFSMNAIQSFAHECVFDKHPYIDYDAMYEVVVRSIAGLFDKPGNRETK